MYFSMHLVRHVCSPLEREAPGLGTHFSKQFSSNAWGGKDVVCQRGARCRRGAGRYTWMRARALATFVSLRICFINDCLTELESMAGDGA